MEQELLNVNSELAILEESEKALYSTPLSETASQYNQDLYRDFSHFVEDICAFPERNQPFHNDLDNIISNPAYKKIVMAAPRGTGKSQHVSFAYPLWEIARNHNLRILVVSNSATASSGFVSQMLDNLERNDKYKAFAKAIDPTGVGVVPKVREIARREEKWNSSAFTIARSDMNIKEPTILSVGLFGSILSKRADIILFDDIVDQQNSETEEQRRKVKDWFYTTILPCLIPGGRVIYVGNTWHMDDLVSNLLKDPQFDYRRILRSIISEPINRTLWQEWADIRLNEGISPEARTDEANKFYDEHRKDMDDGVKVLWPSRFPYSDLYLMRMANPYSFSRMFQCDPSERPDQKIKNEWIEMAIKKGEALMLQDERREGMRMSDTTAGLDLAISLKKGSDDTVFMTLDRVEYGDGPIKTGDYVIRNITRGKMTPKQVHDMVKEKYSKINHSGIRVESVAYQQSMVLELEDFGFPVRGYHTGGEKFDPQIGVNMIALKLEQGKFVIPYNRNDAHTMDECSRLINEMRSWPDGHTGDSVMALWFAISEMNENVTSSFVIPSNTIDVAKPDGTIKTREELDLEADLEMSRKGEAGRRGVGYVAPAKDYSGLEDGELRHFTF
jgi:hypothetical protein